MSLPSQERCSCLTSGQPFSLRHILTPGWLKTQNQAQISTRSTGQVESSSLYIKRIARFWKYILSETWGICVGVDPKSFKPKRMEQRSWAKFNHMGALARSSGLNVCFKAGSSSLSVSLSVGETWPYIQWSCNGRTFLAWCRRRIKGLGSYNTGVNLSDEMSMPTPDYTDLLIFYLGLLLPGNPSFVTEEVWYKALL